MKRFLMPATLAALLAATGPALVAEAAGTIEPGGGGGMTSGQMMADRAVVLVNDRAVMQLASVGDYPAEQRANIVRDRIRSAIEPASGEPFEQVRTDDITVQTRNRLPVIQLRGQDLITVTHLDSRGVGRTPEVVAQQWADSLRGALSDVRLGAGQRLPENFVTVSMGGGAGTAPRPEQRRTQPTLPGGGGGDTDFTQPPHTEDDRMVPEGGGGGATDVDRPSDTQGDRDMPHGGGTDMPHGDMDDRMHDDMRDR